MVCKKEEKEEKEEEEEEMMSHLFSLFFLKNKNIRYCVDIINISFFKTILFLLKLLILILNNL